MIVHPRYQPGPVLGRGAQGVVLRVTDREAPHRALVMKVWRAGAFEEGVLEAEFALLARRRVPGLVRAHDLARDAKTGAPFLVEDFVDGPDLREHVASAKDEPERIRRFARALAETATTLVALHDAGFLHGDLKPAHVRIADRAVLVDLGAAIAARGANRAIAFTRAFAAPEIIAGAPPSVASDLYALGATARAAAAGTPLPPSLGEIVDTLLAPHPRDRFSDARALLSALARVAHAARLHMSPPSAYATLIGRERELAELMAFEGAPSIRYVTGPSGSGKSHLLREAVTRTLLEGRDARLLEMPSDDSRLTSTLIRFFRGDEAAWPYAARGAMLLAIDGLEDAPNDLASALSAYACRVPIARTVAVVATARRMERADLVLGALSPDAFRSLVRSLGVEDETEIEKLARASERMPGFAMALRAGVPLHRDAILARAASVSEHAAALLFAIALVGEPFPRARCERLSHEGGATTELVRAALVHRDAGGALALVSPTIADDIAAALCTFERAEQVAAALLEEDAPSARALMRVANAATPPESRRALLDHAIDRARTEGLAAEEIDAHVLLLADPRERTAARLRRLERLTRDAGRKETHQRTIDWLCELAESDPRVAPLALRRTAEKIAREGDYARAVDLVDSARARADANGDAASVAYAVATRGAIALYAADSESAADALEEARELASRLDTPDEEEIARLDHNLGVTALYAGNGAAAAAALDRSLATKRRLGDLAGVRSCLMNLGIAWAKTRAFEEAERAFEEATRLARTLGQTAGLGWCFVERAELAVRRGRRAQASGFAAEALALGDALPAGVRLDLTLVRAEIALLSGAGAAAMGILTDLAEGERRDDARVDARAWLVESEACLAIMPVEKRRAARAAIRGMRRARAAKDAELTARARAAVERARRTPRTHASQDGGTTMKTARGDAREPDDLWDLLDRFSRETSEDAAAHTLLGSVATRAGAERAFLVRIGAHGAPEKTWAMDVDGLPLADADKRLPREAVAGARANEGAPVYLRGDGDGDSSSGSIVAIASDGAHVLLLQHRFTNARFDALDASLLSRWSTLARVTAMLGRSAPTTGDRSASASASPPSLASLSDGGDSTLQPSRAARLSFPEIVGSSEALHRALARLEGAIESDLPVLVTGETGTGKELFSRAIHDRGSRARAPFVAVNCAAIPDNLFEAELFGHARGAFTGADRPRPGLIARAHGGTLLLDEVGELSGARQASLLRAIESRTYRSVGSDDERAFDVRIVAATNRDLSAAVAAGTFRADLLYRLRVLEVRVPPLRERREDIPLLARHFLAGSRTELTAAAIDALASYAWPGNVRELLHQMQRIAATGMPQCDVRHLPREIRATRGVPSVKTGAPRRERISEEEEVMRAMDATGGNITRAAALLGLTRHGLKKKMLRLGLRAKLGVQG
jgi:transcriptional regulator with AAA-type ATPase domain